MLHAAKGPSMFLGFKENLGQLRDQNGNINTQVKYSLQLSNMSVQLRENGLSYELFEKNTIHRVDLNFLQTNPNVQIESFGKLEGQLRYISQENPTSSYTINAYEKVVYKELYKGIDLECYTEKGKEGTPVFKYNFIVHPGANPHQIVFKANGTEPARIDAKGQLIFTFGKETISERIPISYLVAPSNQKPQNVSVKYAKKGEGLFGFEIPTYNQSQTLVIDPLVWSTYYGGGGSEQNFEIVSDIDSNVYICGSTTSTFGIATAGAHLTTYTNSQDGFLIKFNKHGRLVWGTYFGGTGNELITGLQINAKQELILTGYTNSPNGIASAGSFQPNISSSNVNDLFLASFDTSGVYKWGTYFGGTGIETSSNLAIDPITNQITVVGVTSSTSFSFTFNGYQLTNAGSNDYFIARFTDAGSPIWATFYGGTGNELSAKIATDASGNIYLGGYSYSADGIATANGYKKTNIFNQSDAVFAIFSSTGALKYGTFYGSSTKTDVVNAIVCDSKGKVFLAGETQSTDSIATPGAYRTSMSGTVNQDGMVICFDTSGTLNWCSYIGGDAQDYIRNATVADDGNLMVAGFSYSKTGFATIDALKPSFSDNIDGSISIFSPTGTHFYSSYFGGNNFDLIYGIRGYSRYRFAISGITMSDANLSTPGAQIEFKPGNGYDLFISYMTLPEPISADSSIKNNLIGSNQFLCGSQTASALIGQLPTGGNGTFSYLWLQSTAGAAGLFLPASGLNTSQNYNAGTPSQTTWYKRMVFSGTQNTESNIVQISIGGNLKAGFTVNGLIQCERNNNFIFTDTTTLPDIITRRWDFGDGNIGSNVIENYSYTFGTINYFNVKLYLESAGGCKDSITKTVYLIPNPKPNSISGNSNVKRLDKETYTLTANTGYQYQWWTRQNLGTINNLGSSAEVAWTKSWGTDTLYALEQTGGGCYGDTLMLVVNISPASGEEELAKGELNVYPNPANQQLMINLSNNITASIQLFDTKGSLIYEVKSKEVQQIDVSNFKDGMYLLLVQTEQYIATKKIIIKH
jgi:hypothetical protein